MYVYTCNVYMYVHVVLLHTTCICGIVYNMYMYMCSGTAYMYIVLYVFYEYT